MNIKQKLTSAAVIGAMMATVVAPASFAATVKIKRNGAGSTNRAAVVKLNRQSATQSNTTRAGVFVGVLSNTGGNTANNNTGDGSVNTNSGDVTSTVTTTVGGSTNTGTTPDCGCANNGNITIARNGAGSDNAALIVNASSTEVSQTNSTGVLVGVLVASNTGGNKANGNTGDGSVDTDSGNVTSTVTTTVGGSVNN